MSLTSEIAERLKHRRLAVGWSLDDLAERSGVSRASLSRLENAEVSPTAETLGKLCTAFGTPVSHLLHAAEMAREVPLARAGTHPTWTDPNTGQHRVSLSPPSPAFSGEVLDIHLPAGQRITYPDAPVQGLEHHLILREGRLRLTLESVTHEISRGDRVRFKLYGASSYEAGEETAAFYTLFIVGNPI